MRGHVQHRVQLPTDARWEAHCYVEVPGESGVAGVVYTGVDDGPPNPVGVDVTWVGYMRPGGL